MMLHCARGRWTTSPQEVPSEYGREFGRSISVVGHRPWPLGHTPYRVSGFLTKRVSSKRRGRPR